MKRNIAFVVVTMAIVLGILAGVSWLANMAASPDVPISVSLTIVFTFVGIFVALTVCLAHDESASRSQFGLGAMLFVAGLFALIVMHFTFKHARHDTPVFVIIACVLLMGGRRLMRIGFYHERKVMEKKKK